MLSGKTIVVTGGFGTLGRAVASGAVSQGASVAVLDVAPSAPPGLEALPLPQAALFGGTDLRAFEGAVAALDAVAARFQRIDGLINVAGGFRWETVAEGDVATWDLLYQINLGTALNASKAAIPHLLAAGGGGIVNVGANAALKAAAGMGAYAASKAAVHRLTEAMAEELKASNIRVNAVLPSIIDTPANRADMPDADFAKWVAPEALAAVILFLVSDQAEAITGALLPVTGRV